MEWHVWDFPDNIRVYFTDEFREWLFKRLKKICGSRAEIARRLDVDTTTIKNYFQWGHDSDNLRTYVPVKIIKKIIELFGSNFDDNFLQKLEKNIIAYRCRAGRPVLNPILPIKESPELYSILCHMICDGSAGKGKTPYYANICEELRIEFIKNLQVFGKVGVNVYEAKTGVTYIMFPKAITDILSHIFKVPLVGPRKFPERLFPTSTEYQMIALRAMFDDEGFVSRRGQMGFTTSDIDMVEGIIKLLTQNAFIVGTICRKKRGNKTDFAVPILMDSYEKFLKLVDFTHPRKHKRLKKTVERHKYRVKYKSLKNKIYELLLFCHPLDRIEIAYRLNAKIPMTKTKLYELKREGKIYSKFNGKNKFYLWFPKG